MTLEEQVNQQRVHYIVSRYQLDGTEAEQFSIYLAKLLQVYAPPLIELALAETLVSNWLTVPMAKGMAFLQQAHARLYHWQHSQTCPILTPDQFNHITGLDPTPVFGGLSGRSPRASVKTDVG
jgi:hypothetical protein